MPSPSLRPGRFPSLSRRRLAQVLGVLWILDGALQLQPFMFTTGFARGVIRPAATGQPPWVARAVDWNAHLVAGHPAALDAVFAAVQLGLGLAFLGPRTRRAAVVGSTAWALGVWCLGEGLGGIAGGQAGALVGAPGAALLYAVLALAAWPVRPAGRRDDRRGRRPDPTPTWTVVSWSALWLLLAGLALLPGNGPGATAAQLVTNARSVPGPLGAADLHLARVVGGAGMPLVVAVAATKLVVGLCALRPGAPRTIALWAGSALALADWAFGQSFGQVWSGQATDLNSGPMVLVLALAVAGAAPRAQPRTGADPLRTTSTTWAGDAPRPRSRVA